MDELSVFHRAIQLVPLRGEEAMYLSGNRLKIQSAPGISDHLPLTKIPSFDSTSLPSLSSLSVTTCWGGLLGCSKADQREDFCARVSRVSRVLDTR